MGHDASVLVQLCASRQFLQLKYGESHDEDVITRPVREPWVRDGGVRQRAIDTVDALIKELRRVRSQHRQRTH